MGGRYHLIIPTHVKVHRNALVVPCENNVRLFQKQRRCFAAEFLTLLAGHGGDILQHKSFTGISLRRPSLSSEA